MRLTSLFPLFTSFSMSADKKPKIPWSSRPFCCIIEDKSCKKKNKKEVNKDYFFLKKIIKYIFFSLRKLEYFSLYENENLFLSLRKVFVLPNKKLYKKNVFFFLNLLDSNNVWRYFQVRKFFHNRVHWCQQDHRNNKLSRELQLGKK